MGDVSSPDLPTPGQAIAIAEKIVAGAKKLPDLPAPDQAIDVAKMHFKKSKERSLKQIVTDQELAPSGPFSDITEETDAHLRQRTRENVAVKNHEAPKYIPTKEQCQRLIRRFYAHRIAVEQKMRADKKTKVTTTSKPLEPGLLEGYMERVIETEDGKVSFFMDVGGKEDGKLHIVYDLSFTSNYGEPDEITTADIYIDREGIEIYLADPIEEREENHLLFKSKPQDNEVNENTPAAVQRTEELINLYLRS